MAEVNDFSLYLGQAKEVASAFAEFAKDDGEGKVQDLLHLSKKISKSLGVLGAIMGVASLFMNQKSDDTDRILEAIGKIDKKLDDLDGAIRNMFQKAMNEAEALTAITQIRTSVVRLTTLMTHFQNYTATLKNNGDTNVARIPLMEYKLDDIHVAIQTIADQCTGQNLATDILIATYKKNYGDYKELAQMGTFLFSLAGFGAIAYGLLFSLKQNGLNNPSPQTVKSITDSTNKMFENLLGSIRDSMAVVLQKCHSECFVNMKRFVETEYLRPSFDATDHTSLYPLVKVLQEKWFWRFWTAIGVEKVAGGDMWGIFGREFIIWMRDTRIMGEKSLIIHGIDFGCPELGEEWNVNCSREYQSTKFKWPVTVGDFDEDKTSFIEQHSKRGKYYYKPWKDVQDAFKAMDHHNINEGLFIMHKVEVKSIWISVPEPRNKRSKTLTGSLRDPSDNDAEKDHLYTLYVIH